MVNNGKRFEEERGGRGKGLALLLLTERCEVASGLANRLQLC